MRHVLIIGGGLAGLVSAIRLSKAGFEVAVIEKKTYPFHKVCGEYISQEVLPFFKSLGVDPFAIGASRIDHLMLSSSWKNSFQSRLDLGGFGISRFTLDNHLAEMAKSLGAEFYENAQADGVTFHENYFDVKLQSGKVLQSSYVIGSYGKRSNLDRTLNRSFFNKRSPFLGVKYHVRTDHADNLIGLHNFAGGYSGINRIEEGKYCLCYLTKREHLKQYGSIPAMEQEVLFKNKALKHIFQNSDFLYDKPEVINEISFEDKSTIEEHILMAGDAVGMISPLCGNGMAMAIRSGKMLSDILIDGLKSKASRAVIEDQYHQSWTTTFKNRLSFGRQVQKLFGNELATYGVLSIFKSNPWLANWVIKNTHGNPF